MRRRVADRRVRARALPTVSKDVLRMKEHELDLALEAERFDLRLRGRLEGLR